MCYFGLGYFYSRVLLLSRPSTLIHFQDEKQNLIWPYDCKLTCRLPFWNFPGEVAPRRWSARAMAWRVSFIFPTSLEMYVTCCVNLDTELANSVFAAPLRPHISLVTVTSCGMDRRIRIVDVAVRNKFNVSGFGRNRSLTLLTISKN